MVLDTAVVGAGTVSRTHLRGLQRNPRVELVGICDIDADRARETATDFDIEAYVDFATMLREEALDWVHVCTPVQTHRDIAVQAIEAGVPVLIEKPVTVESGELTDIKEAAEAAGVAVSAVRNHLFTPAVIEARERIDSGALGELRGVDVVYTGNTKPDEPNRGAWALELPGGEFEEGVPHPIYVGLAVGGYPRDEASIRASTSCFGEYDGGFSYDGFGLQWVTTDDGLCSVRTMAGSIPQRHVMVHGERASLTIDLLSQTLIELDRDYRASPVHRMLNNADHVLGRVQGTLKNAYGVVKREYASDWETEKHWNPQYYQYDLEARALISGDDPPIPYGGVEWTVRLMELLREDAAADASHRANHASETRSTLGIEED